MLQDPCWEYCEKMEGNNRLKCNFCGKDVKGGGITRLKYHLSKIEGKGVAACTEVPDEVVEKVKNFVTRKDENREVAYAKKARLAESSSSTVQAENLQVPQLETGPQLMTKFSILGTECQSTSEREKCIAQFFFENKLDFSVALSSSYQLMLEAVGGAGFQGPSPKALKTTLLPQLKSDVLLLINGIKKDWGETGCTILAESWTDSKSKALICFSVSSPLGTFFYKSVDASAYYRSHKDYFELFDSVIQELGTENVVQVITDGNLDFGDLGNRIMMSEHKLFWSPCASYCINLILEDFTKIEWVNQCILHVQTITRFMYNHSWILDLLKKKFTKEQDVVRTGITKSISDILTLQVLLEHRSKLKEMFNCSEYSTSPHANMLESTTCIRILDNNELWRKIKEIAAVAKPLLEVLRAVSGCKAAIGTIYESMTKVKDSIKKYIEDGSKCKEFQDIVDRRWLSEPHSPLYAAAAFLNPRIKYNPDEVILSSIRKDLFTVLKEVLSPPECGQVLPQLMTTAPGNWCEQFGNSAPGLARVAFRILSQVCSTSSLERNWATIQQLHSEGRNKLDKETLSSILYVQNNIKLKLNQRQANSDPIAHDYIDMTSEWVRDMETPNTSQQLDRPALDRPNVNSKRARNDLVVDSIFRLG